MSLRSVTYGHLCGIDKFAFSRSARYLAASAAPHRILGVHDVVSNRKVKCLSVRDLTNVCLRTPSGTTDDRDTEVLMHVRKTGIIQRYHLASRRPLVPLCMRDNYEVSALIESGDGQLVAAGDRDGNVYVWNMQGSTPPEAALHKNLGMGSIHALAFTADGRELLVSDEGHRQFHWNLDEDEFEPIHGNNSWSCYALACHPSEKAFAMAGDSNRVWLVDLPFKLDPQDEDNGGDGFPISTWELDQAPVDDSWSLRNRIYLPNVDVERCAYIESNVGTFVNHLRLSEDWQLLIAGEIGMEVWNLNPLRLVTQARYSGAYWRPVASVRSGNEFLTAHES